MNRLESYLDYFSLRFRPFSLAPNPDFLYWSPAHKRAWTMMEFGLLTCAPITLITGGVGTGKTTLLRHMLAQADVNLSFGLVTNAQGNRGELLQWVLQAFGLDIMTGESYVAQFDRLQRHLIEEYADGRRVVLVFDEAQNLSQDSLEELRMLTNINSGEDELMQLVLIGQPELREVVKRPDMTQFAQRVAVACHLEAMSAEDIHNYIHHRLAVAGNDQAIFSNAAILLIHRTTCGIPRLVNQLAELSMLNAFYSGSSQVDQDTVQATLDEGVFFGGGLTPPTPLLLTQAARVAGNDTKGE